MMLTGRRKPLRVVAGSTLADPNAPRREPVTAGVLNQIGSITKTLAAAIVLQLVADGKLGIAVLVEEAWGRVAFGRYARARG